MEQVLAFPAKVLDTLGYFHGFSTDIERYAKEILYGNHIMWIDRDKAEQDPSYKQIIPYCLLRYKGKVFTYQRTQAGDEKRLHHKYSLGVGGHINPCDGDITNVLWLYRAAFTRELKEETGIDEPMNDTIVGLLYDSSTLVGQVHFGIVHRIAFDTPVSIVPKDKALCNPEWRDLVWLYQNKDKFESWSQFVIEGLL